MAGELSALLQSKHPVSPSRLRDLDAGDRQTLLELARNRAAGVRRATALALLSVADRRAAAPLLRAVLEAENEDEALQVLAVSRLSRWDEEDLEGLFLRLLSRARSIGLRARIVLALGRIGGDPSKRVLEELSGDGSASVRRAARFSARLVQLRAGEEPGEPDPVAFLDPPDGAPDELLVEPGSELEAARATRDVGGYLRGVTLDSSAALRVRAPECEFMLLPDARLLPDPVAAIRRPGVTGIIAHQDPLDGGWQPNWIVTSQGRGGRSIEITVSDTFGQSIWGGTLTGLEDDGAITIKTYEGHRQPVIEAVLELRGGKTAVTRVLRWKRESRPKRRPRPID